MSNDLAESVRSALIDFLAPLREAAADPNVMVQWLASLGHTSTVSSDPAVLHAAQLAESIAQQIEAFDDTSLESWDGFSHMLDSGRSVADVITQLHQFAHDPSHSQVATDLAEEVIALMFATYLRRRHETAFRVGAVLDLIRPRETATLDAPIIGNAVTLRYPRVLDQFNFASISKLFSDPGAALSAVYLPNQMSLGADALAASQRLFPHLALLADALELSWRIDQLSVTPEPPPPPPQPEPVDAQQAIFDAPPGDDPPSPPLPPVPPAFFTTFSPRFGVVLAKSGASEFALDLRASSAQHPGGVRGFVLAPSGSISGSVARGLWQLSVSAKGQIPAVSITPAGVDLMPGGTTVAGGEAHVLLERVLPAGAPPGPVVVLGNAQGTRLELGSVSVDVGMYYDPARKELSLSAGAGKSALVIAPSDGDSFLESLLPANGLRAPFDVGILWTNTKGLALRGGAGLDVSIPVGFSIGGLTLSSVHMALRASGGSVGAEISASVAAAIGPVKATVDRIGMEGTLSFPQTGGNLGVVDLDFAFKPPTAIGLSVDVSGVLTGSGFLYYDPAQSLYAGALQLTLYDQLTLTAIGLITTTLPDGSRGWSLLVFITAEGFQPIQLGLGFTLTAIGGMLGVNRTFDDAVLREGLKTDALGTLLFPRDPAGNAMAVVNGLARAFPARDKSTLVGLLAKICWGPTQLLQFELALILEVGARHRLLALGRVTAVVPQADNDLVRLKADAMGVLDLDAGTLAVDAVLVDSRVAHKFAITGAAAFRAGFGSGPGSAFLYSVGGFNPRFVPPVGMPALDRVMIALSNGTNPRLTCAAYFAVTANTLQFGARAELFASAAGFSLVGDVGFDVLMTSLSHFIADFHASVQLKRGSTNLFKVSVAGTLEGIRPLRLSGTATFSIFWCDFSVSFHATLVDGAPPTVATIDVMPALLAALAAPSSWRTTSGPTPHGVALRKVPAGGPLVVDPLGQLQVTQDVVPLGTTRDVETFGGARVSGDRRFTLTAQLGAGASGAVTAPVVAAFAPGQFFAMTEDERLASPSFVPMQAGLAVGSVDVAIDATAAGLIAAPLAYLALTLDGPTLAVVPTVTPVTVAMTPAQLDRHQPTGAAAKAPVRRVGRARFAAPPKRGVSVATPQFALVPLVAAPPTPGAPPVAPSVGPWLDHQDALDVLNKNGTAWQLVPDYELA
ncbi:MAG: DUF6603 domain-containing protein [bacterium]